MVQQEGRMKRRHRTRGERRGFNNYVVLLSTEEADAVGIRGPCRFKCAAVYRRWRRCTGVRDPSAREQARVGCCLGAAWFLVLGSRLRDCVCLLVVSAIERLEARRVLN